MFSSPAGDPIDHLKIKHDFMIKSLFLSTRLYLDSFVHSQDKPQSLHLS